MKIQQAVEILRTHQRWRMGADILMIEPRELTRAINTLLSYVEETTLYTEEDMLDVFNFLSFGKKSLTEYKEFIQSLKQNKRL